MRKRMTSLLLVLALCLTLPPTAAFAVEDGEEPDALAVEAQEGREEGQSDPEPETEPDGAVADVQALIDALPDAEALDGMDDEDAMAVYEAFQAACDAYYDTLTEEQQAQLKNTEKLAALSGWFSQSAALADGTEENIYYTYDSVDENGNITQGTASLTGPLLTENDKTLSGQYYIVQGNMIIDGNLTVDGSQMGGLVLCAGATLTVNGALIHNGGSSFGIYGTSNNGADAGELVINNSLDNGAAIRTGSTSTPQLNIYSGEVTINAGKSGKLVEGVELYSTSHIHQGTLDGTAVSPEVWGAVSLEGKTLTLAYCQHEHSADQKLLRDDSGATHHRHCKACGFDWASEACYFDNPDHYVPNPEDKANTHLPVCECGNVSATPTPHDFTCVQTDNGQGHTQRCRACLYTPDGEPVLAHKYDTNGDCEYCGFHPVARDEAGNLYESVEDALNAAADGGTVTLEAHTDSKELREEVVFDRADKSVTLEMNGYTLTNEGGPVITVEAGTLTVSGDAVINQTGEIYPDQVNSAVVVSGGKLIFNGKLTAQGGLYGSSDNARTCAPAVYADGGELELNGDLNLNGGLTVTGSAALTKGLSQGTFRVEYLKSDGTTKETVTGPSVSVKGSTNYTNINSLLAANHAFFDTEKKGYLGVSYKSWSGNVIIEAHEHTWAKPESGDNYECTVCGQVCAHEGGYKTGKCEVCGKPCPHALADQSPADHKYYCNDCGQQMFVRIQTDTYKWAHYTTLKEALEAAANGQTVTLLADVSIPRRTGISGDGTTVTLDLNGHKITGGWLDVGGKDTNGTYTACTLKIIGKGGYEPPMYGGIITVDMKATLDLSGWEGGTISSINISDNSNYAAATREAAVIVGPKAGTIGKLSFGNNQLDKLKKTKLSGGSFNEIWVADFGPVKLGELLADGYAFQNGDGSYVEYGTTLKGESIFNVKVVPCPHADAKDGKCLYCDQGGILARVGDTAYDDVGKAVKGWLTNGGTLKLFADYGEGFNANALDFSSASAEWLTIDLNGHGFYKNCQDNIKLSGGKALTITDSSSKGTGIFGPIDADRGTLTLESGHLQGLTVFSDSSATILLKGGKVTSISCPVPIFNLLPNGYALMDDSGLPIDPTITIDDSKTYTVKDSTNRCISSQKGGEAAIGSNTIPFALSLETNDKDIGRMGFEWYIVKEDGTTQKLAASKEDVTPGPNGVYTFDSADVTVDPNGWTDLIVGKTYNVLCVVTGKTSDGTSSKWQTPMRGYKLTVTPADLSQGAVVFTQTKNWLGAVGNIGDGKGTFVFTPYSGNANSATELSYLFEVSCNGRKLTAGSDYTVTGGNTAKWAGTYTLTIEGKGNYTGTAAHQWEIKPYTLSKDLAGARIIRNYDGTTNLSAEQLIGLGRFSENLENRNSKNPILGADQNRLTIQLGAEDFEVSNVKLGSAEAGDTTASFTIKLKPRSGQTAANFVFEDGTSEMTVKEVPVSTAKAFLSSPPEAGELNVANNHAGVYTLDLSKLLPKLESPKEYGKVTYALDTVSINSSYYVAANGSAEVKDGKLILPIQAVAAEATGNIGTVTVKVTSGNIVDFDLTINVNAVNKIVPTGTPTLSKTTLAWGEQLSTITLSGTMRDEANNKDVPGTFAWDGTNVISGIGKFPMTWTFTPDDGDAYTKVGGFSEITVVKSTPSGEPKYTAITASGKTLADAGLTVNEKWPEGTVQWVDENGVELDVSTEVKANTAYRWRFVPTDTEHYNEASGSITLYTVSHGGGSSSGGSDSNPVIKTETKNHADGSVTKTETKKDGTVIETTTGKDGGTSKTETKPDGSSVTETKAADGSTGTVKTDKNGQTEAETTLSGKAIGDAKKNGEAVKAPVEVKATRNSSTAPTVSIELPKGAGETKVEIPVSNVSPGTVAVLVHADGTEEILKASVSTENGIRLTVDGSATVKIVDNSKDFIDTRNHWAKDAIDFVSAHGLVNGMSATIYAPNNSTTRAQLWTILARQADADLAGGATWYEKAQNWAKDKGVSDGANPNAAINRAQMVTMLWRAVGQPAAGGAATFTDVSADSYYADAVKWAVENGITTGVGNGKFDPNATCTRAQIATFLWRQQAGK